MSPGEVIGWIVVAGFGITLIATLLGIMGLLKIEKTYLGKLFILMVVEVISAGFFLFYQEFDPPQLVFDPPIPEEVYLFDRFGEPVRGSVLRLGDEEKRAFPKISEDALKDVSREVEFKDDDLRFRSKAGTYLGSAQNASSVLGNALLTFEQAFQLGRHYAECETPREQPCDRRDSRLGVTYLLRAIEAEDEDTDKKEGAVKQLFFLLGDLRRCQEFQKLATGINQLRDPPQQYHELAETYLKFSQRTGAGANEKLEARKAAFKYYLAYLSAIRRPETNDLVQPSRDLAIELLAMIGKKIEYLQTNFTRIERAILSLEREDLRRHSDEIRFNFSCGN